MAAIDRDKNLLFGIFAAQLRGVRAERIIEAGAAWATAPSRSLAERLLDLGAISASDRELLDRLVAEAIRAHGGDASEALSRWGGVEQAERAFSGSIRVTPGGSVETIPMDRQLSSAPHVELNIPEETPGRYSRISVYGKGGMGRVLLVHDEHMDRDIAMKELLPHPEQKTEGGWTPVGHTAAMVARFLREARLTGLLEHPSIVPVYELGRREDGSLYYTMKLVRGKTMLQAIRAEKLLEGRLKLLPHFLDLCQAIAYAHSRGIIHRDIKPANVMIGDFGETVVLDWGIAKSQGAQDLHEEEMAEALTALKLDEQEYSLETREGEALGTPHYMPPEQAEGRVLDIDKRSDVYSLGAVLYELLTAKTPFTGRTTREILQHVMKDKFQPVTAIVGDAPPELVAICEKCLQKEPAARYQSAKELADDIDRFLSGALVGSFKYHPGQILLHFYRRHRAVLNTAFAGILALLALSVYSYVSITRAYQSEQEQRLLAEAARDKAVLAEEKETQARANSERQLYITSIQVARQKIAERRFDEAMKALQKAPAAHRRWEWEYYSRQCNLAEGTLAGHTAGISDASFSPDGNLLATASDDGTVRIWSASTWAPLHTLACGPGQVYKLCFSPNGETLASSSQDGSTILWRSSSGERLHLLKGHQEGALSLSFSPDGGKLLSGSTDNTARVWDTDSGMQTALIPADAVVHSACFVDEDSVLLFARTNQVLVWNLQTNSLEKSLDIGAVVLGAEADASAGRAVFWTKNSVHCWNFRDQENPILLGEIGRARKAAFSRDGQYVAVSTRDDGVYLLPLAGGAPLSHIAAGANAYAATFSADSQLVAVGRADNCCSVHTLDGRLVAELLGHSDGVFVPLFGGQPGAVLSCSLDGTVKLWNLERLKKTTVASTPISDGRALFLSNAYYLRCGPSGPAEVCEVRTNRVISRLEGHTGEIDTAVLGGDGAILLTASTSDSTARIWDVASGKAISKCSRGLFRLHAAALSPDGALAATSALDGVALLWDAKTGEVIADISAPAVTSSLSFSPDSGLLLSTSADGGAALRKAGTGEAISQFKPDSQPLTCAAFFPDGKKFVTGAGSGLLTIRDTSNPDNNQKELRGHTGMVNGCRFSRDGTKLLTWSVDGTARLWDADAGLEIASLRGGDSGLYSATFDPAEKNIVTTSDTGILRVWDTESATELAAIPLAGNPPWNATFTAESDAVAVVAKDSVTLW